MSDFVERCRGEWRRLGVPDPVAEEMAADLASDISDAAADGISIEELLGTSASDPRAFAASWAAERGLVRIPSRPGRSDRHGRPVLVAFTVVAALALVVAAALLATGEPKVALVASRATPPHLLGQPTPFVSRGHRVQASAAAPIEWILFAVAIVALGFSAWLWSQWGRVRGPILARVTRS